MGRFFLRCVFDRVLVAAIAAIAFGASPASALAIDAASDPAYDVGWQDQGGGGEGWAEPWMLVGSGFSVASSATNGDGDGDANGDIDTDGRAWGLTVPAAEGVESRASRRFAIPLAIGERIAFDMDTDAAAAGGFAGFELRSPGGVRLRVGWVGDSASYVVADGGVVAPLALPYTDEGLHVEFTLTAFNDYTLVVTPLGGSPVSISNFLNLTGGDEDIDTIELYGIGDGVAARQHFFNSIAVPEPDASLGGAAALASGGALTRLRRRLRTAAPS
jgi:hypothetical protein